MRGVLDKLRSVAPSLMAVGVYALPIWYFATHKGRQEYAGYTWWYAAALAVAMLAVWTVPVRDSRGAETVAIASLAGLQAVVVYLLEYVVRQFDYTYTWLLLALPATVWAALVLMANRAGQWLTRESEPATNQMAYGERMRLAAAMGATWLASICLVAVAATYFPFVRPALDDFMPVTLWIFTTGGVGLAVAVVVERKIKPAPNVRAVEMLKQKGVPEAIALEVLGELERMASVQLDLMLASGGLSIMAAWVAFILLGHAADDLVLGLVLAGLVIPIALGLAAYPWYRRRWHKAIISNRFGVEQYRIAAAGTPLAFPEEGA